MGSGITLAAVLHILRRSGIPRFAICPETDFVRASRFYRPAPTSLPNPKPEDLEVVLNSLELESAVLFPCSDDWLRAVAGLPQTLATRFPSSTSCVDALTDKWRFGCLLKSLNIPHPRTELISSREQFRALPDSRFQGAILKPMSSVDFACKHGVKGYFVESRQQAIEALKTIDLPIMLQEFIPGPPAAGYFLDGFRDRGGRITGLFARRRLRMYPAKLGNSTLIESVPIDGIRAARSSLEYLLASISYRGIFSAEFKLDLRDGEFKLIEVNARPWWYVEFAHRCGVDVCSMAYRDALGLPVDAVMEYEIGRRCAFTINDLRASTTSGTSASSLLSTVQAWLASDNTLFHWNDPLPTLRYVAQTVHALFSSHGHKLPRSGASADVSDKAGSLVSTPLSKQAAD